MSKAVEEIDSNGADRGLVTHPEEAIKDRPYRPTAEVTVLCIIFCSTITGTALSNVLLDRTCIHALGYSAETCAQLQAPGERPQAVQDLEVEVQQYLIVVTTVKSVLDGLVPAALSLFLGAWSNTHGRKPLLLWPAFGFALSTILNTVYSYVGALGPWWNVGTVIPYAFAGGSSAFYTGAFCLLNDLSSEKNRTLRLVLLQSSVYVGVVAGSLAATYTFSALGTNNLLIIASCISIGGFVFTIFCIPESVPNPKKGGVLSIFDFSLVKDVVRTCFRRRADFGRAILILLATAYFLDLVTLYGTTQIDYLYARQRLGWGLHEQSIFGAVNTVVLVTGLFLGVIILQRMIKLSDAVVSLISYASCIAEALIRANVIATWMMYMGSGISIFRGLSFPVIRAMLTKRVKPAEVAKVFAFMSTTDAFLPILAPLLYNMVYRETISSLPGTVYYMNALLYVGSFVLMCVAQFLILRHPQKKEPTN